MAARSRPKLLGARFVGRKTRVLVRFVVVVAQRVPPGGPLGGHEVRLQRLPVLALQRGGGVVPVGIERAHRLPNRTRRLVDFAHLPSPYREPPHSQ